MSNQSTRYTVFTIAELEKATETLKAYLDNEIEDNAGETHRFLVDDVVTDIINILTGKFVQ